MESVMVKASDLIKYGRMDAKFFVALGKVKDEYNNLRMHVDDKQAKIMLKSFTDDELSTVSVFGRGQDTTSKKAIQRVIEEYPVLCLAWLGNNIKTYVRRIEANIEEEAARRDKLLETFNIVKGE